MGLPPDEYESIPNECGSTPEEIHENWGFTPKEFLIFFTLALMKYSIFVTYPLGISLVLNWVGGEQYKCNMIPVQCSTYRIELKGNDFVTWHPASLTHKNP